MDENIVKLEKWIKESDNIVFFGGAGSVPPWAQENSPRRAFPSVFKILNIATFLFVYCKCPYIII